MNPALQSLRQSQQDRRAMLAEWRASQTVEFTLPSGNMTVLLRNIDMQDIALSGELPNTLLTIFIDEENDIDKMPEKQQILRMLESGKDYGEFLDVIVRKTLVWPMLAEQADEDHITLDELRQSDKQAIFQWVNREAIALRSFREGEGESDPNAQPGGSVQHEAEPDPAPGD